MLNEHRPTIFRVLQIDYWALLAALFPLVFWIFYLFERFVQGRESFPLEWMVAGTALFGVLLVWRIVHIRSFFEHGECITAIINGIGFYRDRGLIACIYTYQGQKYRSKSTVMKTRRTKALQVGDEVLVLVDRNNPKRAIIRDLYIGE